MGSKSSNVQCEIQINNVRLYGNVSYMFYKFKFLKTQKLPCNGNPNIHLVLKFLN